MKDDRKMNGLFSLLGGGNKKGLIVLPKLLVLGFMFLVSAHVCADDVEINATNFPDPAFRAFVQKVAGGTTLKQTTIDQVTTFGNDLKNLGIKDLTGLKYFTNLKVLFCQNNPGLTAIDLSGNTKLNQLNVTGCKVTSLDFTNNPEMVNINAALTHTLKSINVKNCSKLQYLTISDGFLTELDVTHCPQLKQLSCVNHKLSALDLSNNTQLEKLYAGNNKALTTLDLTHNTKLTYLSVDGDNRTELDVSMLPNLQTLVCSNNHLKELDVSNNPKLTQLACHINQLTSLDLSKNTALTDLDCHNNKLTSLVLNPADPAKVKFISVANNALASIDLSPYSNLVVKDGGSFSAASSDNQTRRMMLYTDGTDAYMNVEEGIDLSKMSNVNLNLNNGSTKLTFTLGTPSNGMVPLKFSNGAARTQLFNYSSSNAKAAVATITYTYDTGSKLSNTQTMKVTDMVECYMLPMSQEYGSVNLPYDVLLPEGATAYAVSATSVKPAVNDNTATLTQIATAGQVVAANTPMLIRRSDNTHTLFALNQSAGTVMAAGANLLRGTANSAFDNNANYFVLGINKNAASVNYNKLGFWRTTSKTIGTWRAYLDLTSSFTGNAKGFLLLLDSMPTGIVDVETKAKAMNTDASWYTLDGRRLGAGPSHRGFYIHNGKKVVISK